MNALHATVAALHSATIPGDVALKGSWSTHAIPYTAACGCPSRETMNTWGGISSQRWSPKYAHLKLKADQIPTPHCG